MTAAPWTARLAGKARHELRQFAVIAFYLWVCFGAVILLKAAVLHGVGIDFWPVGLAALKAAIMAKFMMLGHALRLGERWRDRPLIWPTLYRSVVFLVLLVALSVIEAVASALLHGRTLPEAMAAMGGGDWFERLATILVLLLVLLPYMAFRTLGEAMPPGRLAALFLGGRKDQATP